MGALPKKKLTRARQGRRFAHYRLQPLVLSRCPQCNMPKLPHRVCPNCGHYGGREVLKIKSRAERRRGR
jgi:large subunit ribosomal protein L32